MEPLSADEIRARFLGFFAARGHEVVPSASLVPGGDQTLLFTNSGMVQFKDVFRGVEKRSYTRAVDSQRCLRVAGKHNDFEEVGRTPRHHTLFEMLGNWSFGDYFKREAIHWAWEFLTQDLGIPAERLAATTYRDDEESWAVWRDEIGLPPERMATLGRRRRRATTRTSGAWRRRAPAVPAARSTTTAAPSSPRAPTASPTTASTARAGWRSGTSCSWSSTSSPTGRACRCRSRSVDTGMGLERLASVLQGVATNYDTDLFTPIHARMRELMRHDPDAFESERFSYQVIADHSRAITFLIADGVLPANEGRGYVLRRIVRRAVRHGRLLGRREPFLAETAKVVIELMGEAYPVLVERREAILGAILREETAFARTLDAGTVQLEEALIPLTGADRVVGRRPEEVPEDAPAPGRRDGLPPARHLRLPHRPDRGAGGRVRRARRPRRLRGRPAAPARAQPLGHEAGPRPPGGAGGPLRRHRAPRRRQHVPGLRGHGGLGAAWWPSSATAPSTRSWRPARRSELRTETAADALLVLDRRPSTPRVAARSAIAVCCGMPRARSSSRSRTRSDRSAGLIVHHGKLHGRVALGQELAAEVDPDRRARTMRNHTGTHVLHRALRNTLGDAARQAGSLVTPDYLRFDFPFDRGLTPEERHRIEHEVRRVIREDRTVTPSSMSMAEAVAAGADAFFDEKYGETVRTVRVEGYSHELCGGTHCRATGPDRWLHHHRRAIHRLRHAAHRGRHRRGRGGPHRGALPAAGGRRGRRRRPDA